MPSDKKTITSSHICCTSIITVLLTLSLVLFLYPQNYRQIEHLKIHFPQIFPLVDPNTTEIYLAPKAILSEGIGAVLSGLKPVLLLSNYTGAVITMKDKSNSHGYNLAKYIRFQTPISVNRIPCNLTINMKTILNNILQQCEHFDINQLKSYGIFDNCNQITINKYLNHPRGCVKHTENLVKKATKFRFQNNPSKKNICILRRGGDVEGKIMSGKGNQWAIDKQLTLPIIKELKKRKRRIVLITETRHEEKVKKLYKPNIFSNRDRLQKVVQLLEGCRCSFVAGASSFASVVMQISQPRYIIYMKRRRGFSFKTKSYLYEEYGERAVPIDKGMKEIVNLCDPTS